MGQVLQDLRWFLIGTKKRMVFTAWSVIVSIIVIAWLVGDNINDRTVAVSMMACGLTTLVFWFYKDRLAPRGKRWKASPRTKFVLIGCLGAVYVETIFWAFEKVFGAVGVAASPNLALDLLVTMPWYVVMIILLWKVETTYRYSMTEIVLLGGIYELGADGFIGSLLGGALTPVNIMLITLVIPVFVMVYSFMILPCSYLLKEDIDKIRAGKEARTGNRYIYALLPLLGLIPYLTLAILAMFLG